MVWRKNQWDAFRNCTPTMTVNATEEGQKGPPGKYAKDGINHRCFAGAKMQVLDGYPIAQWIQLFWILLFETMYQNKIHLKRQNSQVQDYNTENAGL